MDADEDHVATSPGQEDNLENEIQVYDDDNLLAPEEMSTPPLPHPHLSEETFREETVDVMNTKEEDSYAKELFSSEVDKHFLANKEAKSIYTWSLAKELMHREHNIINRIGWRGGHTSDQSFSQGFYGSRHAVEQMTLLRTLKCRAPDSMDFNSAGNLLVCTGSDRDLIIWDWAKNKKLHQFRYKKRITNTKFINSTGCVDFVYSNFSGEVFLNSVPPSGGATKAMRLYTHKGWVEDLLIVPRSRHELMSAGEDGTVKLFDIRTSEGATTMVHCVDQGQRNICLSTIAHHPFSPEFCVGGDDEKLFVYDKRYLTKPVHTIGSGNRNPNSMTRVLSSVYNHSGSEILAVFDCEGTYLYDTRNYTEGEYLHFYKDCSYHSDFYGPRSEYIVSCWGDCTYFLDKNTEAIISYKVLYRSSLNGNLKSHPWMPLLATHSYRGPGIHLWIPSGPLFTDYWK